MILQVAELLGVRTHCVELGKLLIHAGQLLEEPVTMLGQGLAEFLTKLLDEKHSDLARIGFLALGERKLVKLLDRVHETPRQRLRMKQARQFVAEGCDSDKQFLADRSDVRNRRGGDVLALRGPRRDDLSTRCCGIS
jgi:hypothetical protein